MFLLIDYSGDYALNDDWGYSTPIRWWIEYRELNLTHWQSMPLIPQLGLGILWSELFGFSQANLRTLVLISALLACAAIYVAAQALRINGRLSLLCAALPLASPMFLGLAYSFMTDVPGAALTLISVAFFLHSLSAERGGAAFALGVVFLIFAVLLRQTAVAVALALIIAEPVAKGLTLKRVLRSFVVLIAAFGAYGLATAWLEFNVGLPAAYSIKTEALTGYFGDLFAGRFGVFKVTLKALLIASSNIGLFTLPLLPIIITYLLRTNVNSVLLVAGGACILALGSVTLGVGMLAVTRGNVLTAEGFGPRAINGEVPVNDLVVWILSAAGHFSCLCGVALIALKAWTLRGRAKEERIRLGCILFIVLTAIIIYIPHSVAYAMAFDRYLIIPSILFAMTIVAFIESDDTDNLSSTWSEILVALSFMFSLMLVSDYFRWQDARYSLIYRLTALGYTPEEIDGGFEYNNLQAVLVDRKRAISLSMVDPDGRPVRLARMVRPGEKIVATAHYGSAVPFFSGTIYAVR
jgi:hypothetical protein